MKNEDFAREEGKIIILNGPSCSGKTTLARDIQLSSRQPYLATGLEYFLPTLAGKYIGVGESIVRQQMLAEGKEHGIDESLKRAMQDWSHPGKLSELGFEIDIDSKDGGGQPRFTSSCGPVGWKLLSGMHRAFAALAKAGNNLIISDVISDVLLSDYCLALEGYEVYLVGLYCSLEELLRRERERSDTGTGAVSMQFEKVHIPGEYDVTVHTDKHSSRECAQTIIDYVENNPPRAFGKLAANRRGFEVTDFPVVTF